MKSRRGDKESEAHAYISPLTVGFVLAALTLEFKVTLYYGCFTQVVLTVLLTHTQTQTHKPSTRFLWKISTFQLLVSSFVLAPDLGSHQPGTHQGIPQLTAVSQWACDVGRTPPCLALPSLPFPIFSPSNYLLLI